MLNIVRMPPIHLKQSRKGLQRNDKVYPIEEILSYLNPNMGYFKWLDIGMALHHGGYSWEVWDKWSQGSPKYSPGVCEQKWNSFTPNDDGITMRTLLSYAREAGWQDSPVKDYEYKIINPQDLEGQPIPERLWILEDWIPQGGVTSLYGDGGTGKSLLALQMMTAAACDKAFLGMPVAPVKTFGFFCEDTPEELHRRQDSINQYYGLNFTNLENMRWYSGVGEDNLLMTFKNDEGGQVTALYNFIEKHVIETGARFVVVDTAADTFGGNENARAQVRQFISLLTGLANKINGAVMLCAHPSAAGMSSGRGDGGNTAWNNSVRSRLYLTRPEGSGQQQTDERLLKCQKSNYGKINMEIPLFWNNGVFISGTCELGNTIADKKDKEAENAFVNAIEAFNRQNRPLSASKNSSNYAPKALYESSYCNGFSKAELVRAMDRLFIKESIMVEEYGRPSNRSKKIVSNKGQA